jgi:ribose 5-phosphate isomerase A
MTIYERAVELIGDGMKIGLGSGKAANHFIQTLGLAVRSGRLRVQGLPTSEVSAALARQVGIPLLKPDEVDTLDIDIDGADEVDPNLDLIKGHGRCLVREKIVAVSSRRFVIVVGQEKIVPQLGSRGKLPVEVVPFGLSLAQRRLRALGCKPVPFTVDGQLFVSDNGNHIIDCAIGPIADPRQFELDLRAIPGVVGTGLFLGLADTVLVGTTDTFELIEERRRPEKVP